MGVDIPQPFHSVLDSVPPMTISGLPDTYHLNVDNLAPIHINVDHIPRIELKMEPVELALRLTEVPSTRTHLPADFCVAFAVFGMEVFTIRLCGEGQMITEPYRPNPCEVCGNDARHDVGHGATRLRAGSS